MRIRFRAPANRELEKAVEWYLAISPETGDRFIAAFDEAVERTLQYPRAARAHEYGFRSARIPGFPLAFQYRIEANEVMVYAVSHDKQEPGFWLDRLR